MYLPKIDFSKLELSSIDSNEWIASKTLVMDAIENYGSFEVTYDKITPELQDALFEKAMKELHSLPSESKMKNTSNIPYHGYVGNLPDSSLESLSIDNVDKEEAVGEFARIMWGDQGNICFCKIIKDFTGQLSVIEKIVRRMVLESLGMEKYFDEFVRSSTASLRLSEYRRQKDTEKSSSIAMGSHTDVTILSIVCQHGNEGLQVQNDDGSWLIPSPYSLTVLIGQAFFAWTNGRIKPAVHRVFLNGANTKRYSAIFALRPEDGYMIQCPEELIDQNHPQLFLPYEYGDYLRFCFSKSGFMTKDTLRTYCGVKRDINCDEAHSFS